MFRNLFLLAACLAGPTTAAFALGGQRPGSLLVFPEFDNRPGRMTFVTITNTNGDFSGRPAAGSVRVHLNYVDRTNCQISNAFDTLTPRDTVTALTVFHNPNVENGYMFAYAVGLTTGAPLSFDYLAGTSIVIDGVAGSAYTLQPIVFTAETPHGTPTDLDGDGLRDLNGMEYSQVPDEIVIPRFFGQANPGGGMQTSGVTSDIILIGLTGGRAFTTSVNFLVFNDNEEAFSGQHSFYCWTRVPLTTLSGATRNDFLKFTNQDPTEIQGFPNVEAGWIRFDGGSANSTAASFGDPAVLAVLVEANATLMSAELPFGVGDQPNGDLLPTSIFGDPSR